jgi:hypothetical protein
MALTTSPFLVKNINVLMAKSPATKIDYRCTLNTAILRPSTGGGGGTGVTFETYCNTFSGGSNAGGTTWTLELTGFQAYADVTDLSNLLFVEEGNAIDYVLVPVGGTVSATNPGFQGQFTATPVDIGGTANQYATFTTSQPCTAKPTKIITPPAGVFAASDEDVDTYGGGTKVRAYG